MNVYDIYQRWIMIYYNDIKHNVHKDMNIILIIHMQY